MKIATSAPKPAETLPRAGNTCAAAPVKRVGAAPVVLEDVVDTVLGPACDCDEDIMGLTWIVDCTLELEVGVGVGVGVGNTWEDVVTGGVEAAELDVTALEGVIGSAVV